MPKLATYALAWSPDRASYELYEQNHRDHPLLLLTRSAPPLPLARWRARNDLHEVSAADLRFLPAETASFLERTLAFPLALEAIGQLDAHLEGWAAGLRLIALALQGHVPEKQIGQFLATFAGSHRHLLEYLVTEVLDAQPKSLQIFLLQTSMLGRLTGSLCDAVTGRNDSARILETVERAGLFLLHLGGTEPWYRYHMFFAEAMQHEARRRLGADALRLCSSRASAWYEEHGMLAEAVESALAASEWSRAAILIERFTELQHLTEHYEIYALQRWLEQLPKAILHATPALCYIYAESLTFSSTSDRFAPTTLARVEAFLQIAEQGWRSESNTSRLGKLFAFRALFVLLRRGDVARAAAFAGQALPWLSEAEASWRGVCVGIVGESERQDGQLDAAQQLFLEARALCEASGNTHAIRPIIIALGDVGRMQGQLHQAAEYYRQMLGESEDDPTDCAGALLGLAQLAYEWNDLDAAAQDADLALDLGQQMSDMSLQVQASLVLARVQYARGATAQAQQTLLELAARMPAGRWPLLQREIRFWQAQLQLATGDHDAVQHWVTARTQDDASLPLLQREREELLVARWLLVQGQADAAARLLDQWLVDAQAGGRTRSILEIQLLIALAQHACKQAQAAQQTLQAVLAQAYAENYQRLFLDEAEPLASLLRANAPEAHEPAVAAYLQTLLRAFSDRRLHVVDSRLTPNQSAMVEPLSPQEQRVLRLLAAGLSNPEIAQELVVSVNTVKTHLQRIYQKLNVTSRREARAAAQHLHL
jgi:LuxR family maltose regulon positive regulatory protein